MPSWLSVSTSAITTLNRWIFQATVWVMAIVVPVMLYEVIARYVFNAPTVWGMELAVLLFGPYFLLGGPYLLHLKGHVALDVARQRLSPAWQRRLDLVNFPIIVLFCAILLYFSAPAAYSVQRLHLPRDQLFSLEPTYLAGEGRRAAGPGADAAAGRGGVLSHAVWRSNR